jgi:hypothetical protein
LVSGRSLVLSPQRVLPADHPVGPPCPSPTPCIGRKAVRILVPISRRFLMLHGATSPTPCIGRKDVRFLIPIGAAASGIPSVRRQAATTLA